MNTSILFYKNSVTIEILCKTNYNISQNKREEFCYMKNEINRENIDIMDISKET